MYSVVAVTASLVAWAPAAEAGILVDATLAGARDPEDPPPPIAEVVAPAILGEGAAAAAATADESLAVDVGRATLVAPTGEADDTGTATATSDWDTDGLKFPLTPEFADRVLTELFDLGVPSAKYSSTTVYFSPSRPVMVFPKVDLLE